MQLLQQLASHIPNSYYKEIELFKRNFKKVFMQHIERLACVLLCNDRRNVPFGGTLCDRADIDVVPTQSAEHSSAQAVVTLHAIPHQSHDGYLIFNDHRFDLMLQDLHIKGFI